MFSRCKNVLEVLYHHAEYDVTQNSLPPPYPGGDKRSVFVVSLCVQPITLLNDRDCAHFDTVG